MTGVFSESLNLGTLMFYTLQSNILVIVLFVMLTIRTFLRYRESIKTTEYNGNNNIHHKNIPDEAGIKTDNVGYYTRFEMVCSINIMLTFLVYWIMLAPMLFTMTDEFPMWTYANLSVHGFAPILCLLDYILFTKRGHIKYRDVYAVCIFPLTYLIGTSIAGLLGYVYFISADDGLPIRFPYFFYDFDRIGMLAFAYIGALFVFLLIIGHVYYWVDKRKK